MAGPLANVVPYEELERRRRRRQSHFDLEVELINLKGRQLDVQRAARPLWWTGCIFFALAIAGMLLQSIWLLVPLGIGVAVFVVLGILDRKEKQLGDEAFRRRVQWIGARS